MWVCFIHFLVLDILFTKDNFQGWWSMDDNYVGSLEAKGFFFPSSLATTSSNSQPLYTPICYYSRILLKISLRSPQHGVLQKLYLKKPGLKSNRHQIIKISSPHTLPEQICKISWNFVIFLQGCNTIPEKVLIILYVYGPLSV